VAIATKIYAKTKKYHPDDVCVMQNHGKLRRKTMAMSKKMWKVATQKHGNSNGNLCQDKNLRRRCCMCDTKPWKIAMKKHGNIDENLYQDQTYDVDVVCATKNRG
jgi:hypothetical protein